MEDIVKTFFENANKTASETKVDGNQENTTDDAVADEKEVGQDDPPIEIEGGAEDKVEDSKEDAGVSIDITEGEDVLDEDEFIKTKSGGKFNSWDELNEAIQKEKEIKFENETSQAIYQMLAEGKEEEVYEILSRKRIAESVQNKSEEEVLKAYIKHQNPEFDSEDVDLEYEETYKLDEYEADDAKARREQKKLSQRIKNDVAAAKEFFNKMAQEVKFPKVQLQEEDDSSAQEYREMFLNSLAEAEKTAKTIPFSWKDDKANLSISGKFEIPKQEVSKYKGAAENVISHLEQKYFKDGKYNAEKMITDLYLMDNFNKIISSAVSQAVNQTRLDMIKKGKNITTEGMSNKTFVPSEQDEEKSMLDKLFNSHLTRR